MEPEKKRDWVKILLAIFAILVLISAAGYFAYKEVYQKGYKAGYDKGGSDVILYQSQNGVVLMYNSEGQVNKIELIQK